VNELERHHAVTQFLYREARLLDERRFAAWVALWSDDAEYLLPTTWIDGDLELREASPTEVHHLRSGSVMLQLRVQKLLTGTAWAEAPASRTVRVVSNVEVESRPDGLYVRSNVVLHRVRNTDDHEVHAASRRDLLVPDGDSWKIRRRDVLLAHGALVAANLEFFL
jgi:ethylbenzene dioxygenase beta subunit